MGFWWSFFSVNISQRCDGNMDCQDSSDEKNCHKIEVDKEAYLKDTPPPPLKLGKAHIILGSRCCQKYSHMFQWRRINSSFIPALRSSMYWNWMKFNLWCHFNSSWQWNGLIRELGHFWTLNKIQIWIVWLQLKWMTFGCQLWYSPIPKINRRPTLKTNQLMPLLRLMKVLAH